MYGGDVPRYPILRYHQRHVVFNGPRLFEERGTGICELRHDAQGDVLVVQGLFRGRYLGDAVIVHISRQKVGLQPYFPKLCVCHNLYN